MTLQAFRMHITPLSPVHIGAGESFEPTNYVIEDGWLHEFDTGTVLDALTAADRKMLLDIGNRRPDTETVKAMQRFFFERRERLMPFAVQHLPVLPSIGRLYAERVGQAANRESNGRQVINRLEIDRTSFDPISRRPVLYGSSLKGAIRTALLDRVNNGRRAEEHKGLHEFQGRLFEYLNDRQRPVLELDPLRLLHVADAPCVAHSAPNTQVWLAVDRKKAPVVDAQRRLRKSRAESKDLYQILECVLPWQHRAFDGQINIQIPESIPLQDRRGQRQLPTRSLWPVMTELARACNRFYSRRLDADLQVLRARGYVDKEWDKSVTHLLRSIKPELDGGYVFLLRVGRHSGAESVTLEGVRQIKILEGRDPQTGKQRSARVEETKTIWLAAQDKDQQQGLLPFGWMLVEVETIDGAVPTRKPLEATCKERAEPLARLTAELDKRRVTLEQARQSAQKARQREAEEATRKAAEQAEAARREKERQARLATMSANMRRIEEFRTAYAARVEQLRGRRDRQNTEYHDRARKLAKDALEGADWTPEEKRAAADAIEEWLPRVIADIDKDQLKKLKLNALRGKT